MRDMKLFFVFVNKCLKVTPINLGATFNTNSNKFIFQVENKIIFELSNKIYTK